MNFVNALEKESAVEVVIAVIAAVTAAVRAAITTIAITTHQEDKNLFSPKTECLLYFLKEKKVHIFLCKIT